MTKTQWVTKVTPATQPASVAQLRDAQAIKDDIASLNDQIRELEITRGCILSQCQHTVFNWDEDFRRERTCFACGKQILI